MTSIPVEFIHATCVALDDFGLLIMGESGSGKSQLGLALMGLGAELVGDDQIALSTQNGVLIAQPAPNLAGMIEARNIGILNAENKSSAQVNLLIDLSKRETHRLPQKHKSVIAGHTLEIVYGQDIPNLHFAVYQWMKAGRRY